MQRQLIEGTKHIPETPRTRQSIGSNPLVQYAGRFAVAISTLMPLGSLSVNHARGAEGDPPLPMVDGAVEPPKDTTEEMDLQGMHVVVTMSPQTRITSLTIDHWPIDVDGVPFRTDLPELVRFLAKPLKKLKESGLELDPNQRLKAEGRSRIKCRTKNGELYLASDQEVLQIEEKRETERIMQRDGWIGKDFEASRAKYLMRDMVRTRRNEMGYRAMDILVACTGGQEGCATEEEFRAEWQAALQAESESEAGIKEAAAWEKRLVEFENLLGLSTAGTDPCYFEQCESLRWQYLILKEESQTMYLESQLRHLIGPGGETIVEINPPHDSREFRRTWTEGKNHRTVEYEKDQRVLDRTLNPETHEGSETTWTYYKTGQLETETKKMRDPKEPNTWVHLGKTWHRQSDGSVRSRYRPERDDRVHYAKDGRRIAQEENYSSDTDRRMWLFASNNTFLADFKTEQKRRPGLTPKQYIGILSRTLKSPEDLNIFFDQFFTYTDDNPPDGSKEQWLGSEEVIATTRNGTIRDDCDGYAILARDILKLQGKNAHVMRIHSASSWRAGHALCIWTEQDKNGKYHAHTMCTFPYDRDGNVMDREYCPTKAKGYETLELAIESVLTKYEAGGLGFNGDYEPFNPNAIHLGTVVNGQKETSDATIAIFQQRAKP